MSPQCNQMWTLTDQKFGDLGLLAESEVMHENEKRMDSLHSFPVCVPLYLVKSPVGMCEECRMEKMRDLDFQTC